MTVPSVQTVLMLSTALVLEQHQLHQLAALHTVSTQSGILHHKALVVPKAVFKTTLKMCLLESAPKPTTLGGCFTSPPSKATLEIDLVLLRK